MKSLKRQIFPMDSIYEAVVSGGLDVRTIKANQMEAQGDLGGIAVPPDRQTEVTTRLPGLTAVRGGGAKVITLVNSNSAEIPDYKGNSDQYMGLLRMKRGTETGKPAEQNFEIGFLPVVAYISTMKVPMSMSTVEDASNLIALLMQDIATTQSMGEDIEFLVGDGVNKAYGILPGGANDLALKEVVTGDADELTVLGIKAMKRGIASQYRKPAVWVGTSLTFGRIESFTAGAGVTNWAFPDLAESDKLLNHSTFEQESMPEIAAGTYPLIFGDMSGYVIVERLGMTIERFHDSNTGINMVQYEVRKRVGGRLERPWKFAVQKCATGDPFS
jgi:HK97 family phage major capsid protein